MQLSLALPIPLTEPQRVWFLAAAADRDLSSLRRALQDSLASVLDARSGLRAIAPHDLVFLRVGDDAYEPYGCTGPIGVSNDRDWTRLVGSLLSPHGQTGQDLLCIARGRADDGSEVSPGTPIENLFRMMRWRRLPKSARKDLCRRALATLHEDHTTLSAVICMQTAWLDREACSIATPRPTRASAARPAGDKPRWIARAATPPPIKRAAVVRDLFGRAVHDAPPPDISYRAVRILAVVATVYPALKRADFSQFTDHRPIQLDETVLSRLIASVTSYRIIASARMRSRREQRFSLRVDYEVRQRFDRLVPKCSNSNYSSLHFETAKGDHVILAASARLGDDLDVDISQEWCASGRVNGCVVFTVGGGQWARQPIDLPIPA